MREILTEEITRHVRDLAMRAATDLGDDVRDALERAQAAETSPTGLDILGRLIENADIARREKIPMCQDTGMAVVFIEMGQEVHIQGGLLTEAIHEGVRQGYADGYLRKSVCDPITRQNTGDNTPAVIHLELVAGERFKITLALKGFGSENMSRVTLLPPSAGIEGARDFIVQRVAEAGPNPCPPTIIGVGIGGTMEMAALMAKKALLRPLGSTHPDPQIGRMESEWLARINCLGIGPQGLGGRVTALAVHINTMPTHIASIPVAVNIQCHASRHKAAEL
ncbi:MAG: fumarate hydratase [Desulfobacteraceae bacterium]|nr:MAG: fumarate hydratase [Desulfobacteraceae bacterium]